MRPQRHRTNCWERNNRRIWLRDQRDGILSRWNSLCKYPVAGRENVPARNERELMRLKGAEWGMNILDAAGEVRKRRGQTWGSLTGQFKNFVFILKAVEGTGAKVAMNRIVFRKIHSQYKMENGLGIGWENEWVLTRWETISIVHIRDEHSNGDLEIVSKSGSYKVCRIKRHSNGLIQGCRGGTREVSDMTPVVWYM